MEKQLGELADRYPYDALGNPSECVGYDGFEQRHTYSMLACGRKGRKKEAREKNG